MSEEFGEDPGPFWRVTEWLQQAVPFNPGRGPDERVRWGPRPPVEALFEAVRAGMVGRRVEVGEGVRAVAFTLTALDARFEAMAATAGQADGVKLTAEDVEYAGLKARRTEAALCNVHTRIGIKPALVASPIDLAVVMSAEEGEAFAARYVRRMAVRSVGAGRVRLLLAKHPRWGWVEAELAVIGGRVTLRADAVGVWRWSWRLRRRPPAYAIPVNLPFGLRVTDVTVGQDAVTVRLRVDEWRFDYSRLLGVARKSR